MNVLFAREHRMKAEENRLVGLIICTGQTRVLGAVKDSTWKSTPWESIRSNRSSHVLSSRLLIVASLRICLPLGAHCQKSETRHLGAYFKTDSA